jgi:GNAT acetyltransferase-like protein
MGAGFPKAALQPEAPLPLPTVAADLLGNETSNPETISFNVGRGPRGLESIRREWQQFVDRQGPRVALAHAPQWYDAYLEASAQPQRVYFFVARRGSDIVAIFPLERRTLVVLGVPLAAWVLPHHDHMPFSDVIAPVEELPFLIPPLLGVLKRHGAWALLVARNVLADSSLATLARDPRFAHHVVRGKGHCHYLDCDQPYDSLLASFSRKQRANLRRHRANLSSLGVLETVMTSNVGMMERCFSEFLEVEGSGWKGRSGEGTAIALHPDLERYYRRLLQTFGARGECELNLLRLDGRCIAAQFCVTVAGVWYLLKIGYDEQYAKYSPGTLLLEDVLIRLCASPNVKFANLASDASWHLNWSPLALGMADYQLAAPGAGGHLAVFLLRTRARLVRELHRVRGDAVARWNALWRLLRGDPSDAER